MNDQGKSEKTDRPAPTVFISYSHDSADHKMWVAGLATDLRRNGIDAILDQWGLRLGVDLTNFIERGIGDSNRVCMICTPEYARKANAGSGGVGYEKMIITGELYDNLGSAKFIPAIISGTDDEALPSFLKSKFYVDFRDSGKYQEKLKEILRELHDVPENIKPPLGSNPFLSEDKALSESDLLPPSLITKPIPIPDSTDLSPDKVYATCLELFRRADSVGWRELVKNLRRPMEQRLMKWLSETQGKQFATMDEFLPAVDSAVEAVMPLMTMAIASVESRVPTFTDQRSVVDDFLSLSEWPKGGLVPILKLPRTLVYVYHYLHGATCLNTTQHEIALSLATMNVLYYDDERKPLWIQHDLSGWPKSLGENNKTAWDYLLRLPERFPWLHNVFIRKDDYEVSLAGYNMLLSSLDLASAIKYCEEHDKELSGALRGDSMFFDVPPMFIFSKDIVREKAFSLAFRDANCTSLVAKHGGVEVSKLRAHWKEWVGKLTRTMSQHVFFPDIRIEDLP